MGITEHKNWCEYRSGRVRRVCIGKSGFWRKEFQGNGLERENYWVKETGEELAKTCAGTPSQLGP